MKRAVLVLALVLTGASCGGDGGSTPAGAGSAPPRVLVEALSDHDGQWVVADGALLAQPGHLPRLCEALAESYPPQCGGASIDVPDLDPARIRDTSTNADAPEGQRVVWTDGPIQLLGKVTGTSLLLASDPLDVKQGAVLVTAVAGPTCPVETNPPDPACANRPVAGAEVELQSSDGVVGTVTDALGVALFLARPGNHTVVAFPVAGLIGTPQPQAVTVEASTEVVALAYDTGIR